MLKKRALMEDIDDPKPNCPVSFRRHRTFSGRRRFIAQVRQWAWSGNLNRRETPEASKYIGILGQNIFHFRNRAKQMLRALLRSPQGIIEGGLLAVAHVTWRYTISREERYVRRAFEIARPDGDEAPYLRAIVSPMGSFPPCAIHRRITGTPQEMPSHIPTLMPSPLASRAGDKMSKQDVIFAPASDLACRL